MNFLKNVFHMKSYIKCSLSVSSLDISSNWLCVNPHLVLLISDETLHVAFETVFDNGEKWYQK